MEGASDAGGNVEKAQKAKEARLKAQTETEAQQLREEQAAQAAIQSALSGARQRSESEVQYEVNEEERAKRVDEGRIEEEPDDDEYDGPSEAAPPKTARGAGSRGEGDKHADAPPCGTIRGHTHSSCPLTTVSAAPPKFSSFEKSFDSCAV